MGIDDVTKEVTKEVAKKVANEVWENRSKLSQALSRAWNFIRGSKADDKETEESPPPRPILLLGPGGTGKTTLSRVLTGDVNVLIDPPEFYQPSRLVETVPLVGEPGLELVVMPGQENRLQGKFAELKDDIVKGVYRGIIFVADYGHNAIESEWAKNHKLYAGNKKEFVENLIATQIQEELDLLDKLIPTLKAITQKLWFLVVVLKQDLWAPKTAGVIEHYERGAWGQKLQDVTATVDRSRFHTLTAYACLHIQNWTTKGGRDTLKKNTAGYDATRQRQSIHELLAIIDTVREWEVSE
jgi:hypothetical protein